MTSLKPLFISKVRVKLLQIFLNKPHEMFYVRQLVRMTEEEINAVRRELQHMQAANMVASEQRGNRLYYWFRDDYTFYEDLMSMVAKNTGLGKQFIKLKNKLGKLYMVMFAGRFVFQEERKPDQVDILIVGDVVLPEINALIQSEEAKRGHEINYTYMSKDEFKYRRQQRDPFLLGILMSSRVMIIGHQLDLVS